ncbi:MAG: hypothetical protein B7Z67_14130, partial [Acidiphilium sp. 21-60-14]
MSRTLYEFHIETICDKIVEKYEAGEAIDTAAINQRLEAGNPANWQVHALCGELRLPGFYLPRHEPALDSDGTVRKSMTSDIQKVINEILVYHQNEIGDAGAAGLHFAMQVDVGLGKSATARQEVSRFISEARLAGSPHRVLWLVPHHRLSNETLKEFNSLGLTAMVWRGRETTDPGTNQAMCLDIDAIKEAQAVHADVEKTVCGTMAGSHCPFLSGCRYLQQKQAAASADVVIAANNALFTSIPIKLNDFGLVVVDEGFWQRGVPKVAEISLSSLVSDVSVANVLQNKTVDLRGTKKLIDFCSIIERAAKTTADNEFLSAASIKGRMSVDDAQAAAKLEWARKVNVDSKLKPNMGTQQRKKVLEEAALNPTLSRRSAMWVAIEAMLSDLEEGRLLKASQRSSSGSQTKINLYNRHKIHQDIACLPILHLDATLEMDLVNVFLPHMKLKTSLRAATPHQHITQVLSTRSKDGFPTGGFGKTSMLPSGNDVNEDSRRDRRIGTIRNFIKQKVDNGTGLVITYMDMANQFAGIPGVDVAHFNAISGLDMYGAIDCLFVIGR